MKQTDSQTIKFVLFAFTLALLGLAAAIMLGEFLFRDAQHGSSAFTHTRFTSDVVIKAEQLNQSAVTRIKVNLPPKLVNKTIKPTEKHSHRFFQNHFPSDFFDVDEVTRHYIRPDFSGYITQTDQKGKETYRFFLKMDSKRRRYTPHQDDPKRKNVLLFFGCSFVFGMGLEQEHTLPAFMAEYLNDYRVFNYGLSAASPGNMLKIIQQPKFADDISRGQKVKAVYLYIDHHINRVIGSLDVFQAHATGWPTTLPSFQLVNGSELVQQGTLASGSFDKKIYQFLGYSSILKKLGVHLPLYITESDMRLISMIILNMKLELEKRFPNLDFYVAINPGATGRFLVPFLDELGIKSINYTGTIIDDYITEDSQTADGHPSKAANKFLAEQLIRDLHLK